LPGERPATGRFITLEGGEGAGKSTQARRLSLALAAAGHAVLRTREPGGTPGAERLRGLLLSGEVAWSPLADTMLHFAARAEHVAKLIRPALAAGMWVVCDRFFDSTMAYQGHALGGDRAAIAALAGMIGLRPDLTIMLDLPVAEGMARIGRRGDGLDRYERMGADFFARVGEGFRAIAAADPDRCVLVPAAAGEDAVAARIAAIVAERLG
jgi:dTMP kinase